MGPPRCQVIVAHWRLLKDVLIMGNALRHLKNAIHYTCSLLMEEATTRNHVRMESQLPSDNDVDDVDDDDDLKTSSLQR